MGFDYEKLADAILYKAKGKAATNRSITVSNEKILKKTEKIKASYQSEAGLFSATLVRIRRELKHRGINQIKQGDSEWLQIKEVAALATEFCNEYGLVQREGYEQYCRIALGMMRNYSLNKFKSLHPVIFKQYDALEIIRSDKYPERTLKGHDIYCSIIEEKVGYVQGYKQQPEKYMYFVLARIEADKFDVPVGVYIKAQFVYLEFTNSFPDPVQLIGQKAIERLQKHCYDQGIKLGKKAAKINWDKIRKQ